MLNVQCSMFTYKFPRPSVTADCIVVTREPQPRVLLIQRGNEPFKGCWALPGGFMEMDESIDQCAVRELREETGVEVGLESIRLVGVYSKLGRDPRGRCVTAAYLTFVDAPLPVEGLDDASRAEWFPLSSLPPLAFDHADIMRDAIAMVG